jgi:hypothetical protein
MGTGAFNNGLAHSLITIRATKTRLSLSTTRESTASVLVSQIGLCDVLLEEIRAIRLRLAGQMKKPASASPRLVFSWHPRKVMRRPTRPGEFSRRSR